MKVAILIQAHKNPQQVARLCKALAHPDIDIFMHLDAKTDIASFKALIPQVIMVKKRINVLWGGFSQVKATINSLRQIKQCGVKYNYVALISGQDYPVITPSRLIETLRRGGNQEYLSHATMDFEYPNNTADKVLHYHFILTNRRLTNRLRKWEYRYSPFRRKYPITPVYKGDNWWTLTPECIDYILEYAKKEYKFVNFHRFTESSDEIFFHNIIMHSPFAERVENNSHRYIDWSQCKANPEILTCEDYDKIVKSDAWFARKFDTELNSNILDMLDKHLSQQETIDEN